MIRDKFSDREIIRIKKLVKHNVKPDAIADILNRPVSSIYSKLTDLKLNIEDAYTQKYHKYTIDKIELLRTKQLTYNEIANILDIPVGSVVSIINRKLKHLKDDSTPKGYLTVKEYITKYNFKTPSNVKYYMDNGRVDYIKKSKLVFIKDAKPRERLRRSLNE